jgi:hypothetical protein
MSLKVKCFATVIESGSHPQSHSPGLGDDGHIEIHSNLYELYRKDFISVINQGKDVLSYTFEILMEDDSEKIFLITSQPIFTKYASVKKQRSNTFN